MWTGLKCVLVITTDCAGCPINGKAVGLFDGADVGVRVQNKRLLPPFIYLYLIAFWLLFVKFCVIGSQKNEEVINVF